MSIIISQSKKVAFDSSQVQKYFVCVSQFDGYMLSACITGDKKPNTLGSYKSELEAKKALETTIRAVASDEKVVLVPDEDTVQATLHGHTEVWHHATGKKTKGHGGS